MHAMSVPRCCSSSALAPGAELAGLRRRRPQGVAGATGAGARRASRGSSAGPGSGSDGRCAGAAIPGAAEPAPAAVPAPATATPAAATTCESPVGTAVQPGVRQAIRGAPGRGRTGLSAVTDGGGRCTGRSAVSTDRRSGRGVGRRGGGQGGKYCAEWVPRGVDCVAWPARWPPASWTRCRGHGHDPRPPSTFRLRDAACLPGWRKGRLLHLFGARSPMDVRLVCQCRRPAACMRGRAWRPCLRSCCIRECLTWRGR
jgi:hypothetical protein